MKTRFFTPFLILILGILAGMACHSSNHSMEQSPVSPVPALKLQLVTDQVPSPLCMAVPEDSSGRLFICQKEGRIWIVKNNKLLMQPFLDLENKLITLNPGYDERGLLGMAFSPHFKTDGKFYVYYSAPSTTQGVNNFSILAEYKVSAANPDRADLSSERILLKVPEPESNHNGGELQFGPDGYLYIGLGDGGGGGDKHGTRGNGQSLNTLLGKILRIDVNGAPYNIPADNPFVGRQGARPEIWAYGLRNPWRFSFDEQTGRLFAGDVGQNKYEEVDIIQKGGNYGWRLREGNHAYTVSPGADTSSLIPPVNEYGHDVGISIAGGYIYRGRAIPQLWGYYVFGDYNGKVFLLENTIDDQWIRRDIRLEGLPSGGLQIYSFGQDASGELYVLGATSEKNGMRGKVFKIIP